MNTRAHGPCDCWATSGKSRRPRRPSCSRLAEKDPSPVVRLQLAASAKRLPGSQCLPIVERLLRRDLDSGDERIAWSVWWALEDKAISDADELLRRFGDERGWETAWIRDNILRLIRRYAAEGSQTSYGWCLRLLKSTPSARRQLACEHLNLGLAERSSSLPGVGQGGLFEQEAATPSDGSPSKSRTFEPLSEDLKTSIQKTWEANPHERLYIELALRANLDQAYENLKSSLTDAAASSEARLALLTLAREFGREDLVEPMLALVAGHQPDAVKLATLEVLSRFESPQSTRALFLVYRQLTPPVRAKLRDVLLSRATSAKQLLEAVDRGEFPAAEVAVEQLRPVGHFHNQALDALVRKHWGNIGPGTPEEKLATMRRYSNDLRAGAGDPAQGKALFVKHCAVCHTLYGEGNKVGPDLTTANRKDRAALLANLVDPSAVIRREYLNYVVETKGGQILTGLLAEQDAGSVTVLDAKNQRIKLPRDQVEGISESNVSLMPEKILDPLSPQELRDLFSYLEK